ncbi:hypothetical protein ACFV3R_19010 [Streptomyces sp. NPDC059740]|uniref:hypothetical protein n=1 Tax=Streptomyces sp. NPDC059740 TaxID=3346926 RepID=UPI003649AFC0
MRPSVVLRTVAGLAVVSALATVPAAHATTSSPRTGNPTIAAPATNKLQANPRTVKVREEVEYSGRTSGIRAGTRVQLQQLIGNHWTNVQGKTDTITNNAYTIKDDFRTSGKKSMRTVAANVHSNTVFVTVK